MFTTVDKLKPGDVIIIKGETLSTFRIESITNKGEIIRGIPVYDVAGVFKKPMKCRDDKGRISTKTSRDEITLWSNEILIKL